MRSVETEGGSIDEAIERALSALHVTRDQVEIEILESATRGLFGIGGRPARVRASVRQSLSGVVDGRGTPAEESVSRETVRAPHPTREASAARARQVLEVILEQLVDSPRIEDLGGVDDAETLRFTLSGAESGIIIGRRGQTLDALEHLVSRVVSRDDADPGFRVALDVEGYRQRRKESLEDMARHLGAKARATGRPVTLSPMSPRDRRVVHLALEPEPGVTTVSEGEGLYRRVVIRPEGASTGRGDGGVGPRHVRPRR
jgi:spoIIIJ-associated protein